MGVTIYADWISQPCRAVVALCRIANIPHTIFELRVHKGEHLTEEFERISPDKRLPAIIDGKFSLFESHAILRYLCNTNTVPDNLYPRGDFRRRGTIDAYLDWHHQNTRYLCVRLLKGILFADNSPEKIDLNLTHKQVAHCFKLFETYWLKDGKYIGGADQLSIADLSAYCEIIQLLLANFDYSPYPILSAWMARMKANPEVEEVHATFYKILATKKTKL